MKTLGQSLSYLNKYLDKSKYGIVQPMLEEAKPKVQPIQIAPEKKFERAV